MGDQQLEYIKVGKHPQAGARAFCIVRSDGVEETFSMKKCVSAWARIESEKANPPKSTNKATPQKKPSDIDKLTENVIQGAYTEGISGLMARLQRVMILHSELGKEIEQIQKLLADESKR